MKRVGLYVRVSTIEQKRHGLSVDNQIDALKKYCEDNNYIIHSIYNDAGFSASKSYKKRPELMRMIKDCANGEVSLILFTRLDRFFRNVPDYYACVEQMNDVPWQAIWEDYETITSAGRFKVNIMLSIAQAEAERTAERIKAVNKYRKEQGAYIGKAPRGYKVKGSELVIDQEAYPGIKAIFETYISTGSIRKAMIEGAKYGQKFDRITLLQSMRNPAYYGNASGGYKCEPYITKEQYDIMMAHIGQHSRKPKAEGRVYLYSGILKCGYCGYRMVGHAINRKHADGTKVTYLKYECGRHMSTVVENHPHIQVVESFVEEYLMNNIIKEIDLKVKEVRAINESNGKGDALTQKKNLEAKLKRIATLYEDGDIDTDTYREKRDSIKSQIASLNFDELPEPTPLPDNWLDIYMALDREHKQAFWKNTIKSMTFTNETKDNPRIDFL